MSGFLVHQPPVTGRLTAAVVAVAIASGLAVQVRRILAGPPFSRPL